ncbi:MAG: hypothetical protein JSS29_13850 [Proteobacteria bacterium]|nr:hypothetical protein [Pseudomonadota bacterium]
MNARPPFLLAATYPDRITAQAMLGLLHESGIPAVLETDGALPGPGSSYFLQVPAELVHRARWVLEAAQVSDRELNYLATRELSCDPEEGAA